MTSRLSVFRERPFKRTRSGDHASGRDGVRVVGAGRVDGARAQAPGRQLPARGPAQRRLGPGVADRPPAAPGRRRRHADVLLRRHQGEPRPAERQTHGVVDAWRPARVETRPPGRRRRRTRVRRHRADGGRVLRPGPSAATMATLPAIVAAGRLRVRQVGLHAAGRIADQPPPEPLRRGRRAVLPVDGADRIGPHGTSGRRAIPAAGQGHRAGPDVVSRWRRGVPSRVSFARPAPGHLTCSQHTTYSSDTLRVPLSHTSSALLDGDLAACWNGTTIGMLLSGVKRDDPLQKDEAEVWSRSAVGVATLASNRRRGHRRGPVSTPAGTTVLIGALACLADMSCPAQTPLRPGSHRVACYVARSRTTKFAIVVMVGSRAQAAGPMLVKQSSILCDVGIPGDAYRRQQYRRSHAGDVECSRAAPKPCWAARRANN